MSTLPPDDDSRCVQPSIRGHVAAWRLPHFVDTLKRGVNNPMAHTLVANLEPTDMRSDGQWKHTSCLLSQRLAYRHYSGARTRAHIDIHARVISFERRVSLWLYSSQNDPLFFSFIWSRSGDKDIPRCSLTARLIWIDVLNSCFLLAGLDGPVIRVSAYCPCRGVLMEMKRNG